MSNQTSNNGFNTVNDSAVPQRQTKRLRQKQLLLLICVVAALMLITLMVLAIGAIVQAVKDDAPQTDPSNPPAIADKDIDWETITVSDADTKKGILLVVNKDLAYTFPENDDHLTEINKTPLSAYSNLGLTSHIATEAVDALNNLITAYVTETGHNHLVIRYAYRTAEEQENFTLPAPSGYSDHHTGLGCELRIKEPGASTNQALNEKAMTWLKNNAAKYGFIVRYPADKMETTGVGTADRGYTDYIRFVGVPHATLMTQNNLCMEEYPDYLAQNAKEGLEVIGADGKTYKVYYYDVNGETDIEVPTNCTYILSGTNKGSVVVTVSTATPAVSETESGSNTTSESTTATSEA